MKDTHLHFSGATDVTGKALAEEIGCHGSTALKRDNDTIYIGWGCKTKEDVNLPKAMKVLNHPNMIRSNRNKLTTLTKLAANKAVNVAAFCEADKLQDFDDKKFALSLPVIGRTNYHQGGKGFWLCLTKQQVQKAIAQGAQYFQNYIDIATEYRLHIFKGKLLWAVKKVEREENHMDDAFIEQYWKKVKASADKAEKVLNEEDVKYAFEKIRKRVLPLPDQIIKSNMRGWKFSHVKDNNVSADLLKQCVDALKAVGLDFGAVDCCVDETGKPWIIEINTGPGLDKSPFDAYVKAFKDFVEDERKPAPIAAAANAVAAGAKKVAEAVKGDKGAKKDGPMSLKQKLDFLGELCDGADAETEAFIEGKAAKLFGK
jgi:hypothetical protein